MGRSERLSASSARRVVKRAFIVLLAVALVAANVAVALMSDTIGAVLGSDVVRVTSDEEDEVFSAGRELAKDIEGEGLVLVRNEDETLPLDEGVARVNVFGWASTQWVTSGSGSAQTVGESEDLLDALEERGIEYNTDLTDMYQQFHGARDYDSTGTLLSTAEQYCRLYEPSITDETCYAEELLANARQYSDTAIVVISRTCGESVDCPTTQYKVNTTSGDVVVDGSRHYLELSSEEEALLAYVGATYENVIVIVNSTNTMELGELETIEGIDACLVVGATGEMGASAVVDALWGDVNPSGRLSDTYAYDLKTAASWANSGADGTGSYLGSTGLYPADGTLNVNVSTVETYESVSFIDYVEGIYVGYRWYETADVEGFWDEVSNEYGEGYDGVVQYPFGYGLSYTTFEWEVTDVSATDGAKVDRETEFSITVLVTNTGDVSGKDVVELYASAPYYEGGIEKASTVLVAYAKTDELAPRESCEVTLTFCMDDLASYDCYDANDNGFAGYELEAGDYVVELKRDAHTVADCAGATTTLRVSTTTLCECDLATGAEVGNLFTGDDAEDGVSIDGSDSGGNITYLTRADFEGTFPTTADRNRTMSEELVELNLYGDDAAAADAAQGEGLVGSIDITAQPDETDPSSWLLLSQDGELTALGSRLGSDYDDDLWETILDSMSVEDMKSLVLHGYLGTVQIEGIGKARTKDVDGPAQVGSFNQLDYGVGYPNATVLAQTWNAELAEEYGQQMGLECAVVGVDGWYAPSMNLHRTPLGGRNYEYYSEDPLLSGTTGAAVVTGSLESGTYCYVKHFVANNQETNRDSVYTWLTEQSLRELYLQPFEIGVKAGMTGIMTSYNRIGATWTGGSSALLTGVLRDEWGFEGCVITDYVDHPQYMSADQALAAGGDLYMDGVFASGSFEYGYTQEELEAAVGTEDEAAATAFLVNLRRAAKNVIYVWLNARVTNLEYNDAAEAAGMQAIDRPIKTAGVNYLGTVLAVVDAAAMLVAAARLQCRRDGLAVRE